MMGNRQTPLLYTFILHPKRLICIRELELRDLDVFLFLPHFFVFLLCKSSVSVSLMVRLVGHDLRTLRYERGKEGFEEHPGRPHE